MPIYEYICQKCGSHLEIMQKMSDAPLSRCPECRGKLEKVFSQTSFQLKGSGWYATDYTSRGKETTPVAKETATCASTGGDCATGKCEPSTN